MGIKKRNKVSAEFSMSSLTDIIFLLLIFFMLTSSLVAPNSLNLKLPGSKSSNSPSTEEIDDVRITKSGKFRFNGKTVSVATANRKSVERCQFDHLQRWWASTKVLKNVSEEFNCLEDIALWGTITKAWRKRSLKFLKCSFSFMVPSGQKNNDLSSSSLSAQTNFL